MAGDTALSGPILGKMARSVMMEQGHDVMKNDLRRCEAISAVLTGRDAGSLPTAGARKAPIKRVAAHVHPRGLRDLASYIGLCLIAVYWIRDLIRQYRKTGV